MRTLTIWTLKLLSRQVKPLQNNFLSHNLNKYQRHRLKCLRKRLNSKLRLKKLRQTSSRLAK